VTCSILFCCESLKYDLKFQPRDQAPAIPELQMSAPVQNGTVLIEKIDDTVVTEWYFYLFFKSTELSGSSHRYRIEILFDCKFDKLVYKDFETEDDVPVLPE
jgi:hypothetical protein